MSCAPCEKAKGLAKDMGAWVGSGMPLLEQEAVNHRMTLCRSCEHFKDPLCSICGCLMIVKTRMATTKCPKGRW